MAQALEGITVLELSRVSPGAFCTMMLGDMGAEVLKIETPPTAQTAAGLRRVCPDAEQAAFSYVNRNKRSIGVNLKAPQGGRSCTNWRPTLTCWWKGFDRE